MPKLIASAYCFLKCADVVTSAHARRPVRAPTGRPRGLALPFALVAALILAAAPAQAATSFAAGSYIIPMDATYQNSGMFKAYGLVYRLLAQGVPVSWAIRPGKGYPPPGPTTGPFTGANPIDFTASVNDLRLATVIGAYNYSGGPFIIDSANAAAALPIITAWWAANANLPNVHRATVGFTADVDIVLNHAPRIAVEQTNSGIAIAYLQAAGIPDDNGAAWTSLSPNIFDEAKIASGQLLDQNVGCGKIKWDVFVTPHNGGYSYSLTDPADLGTRTYSELDKFVFYGGGWIALCHSILSNEDNISDLYRNGSAAVRSLFLSTQNTGFLTQSGFGSNIVNNGGVYKLNGADLPIGQAVTTSGAVQALPGGSVQTWQTVPGGFPTGVQYLNGVERVAWFESLGKQYDHVVNGVYHGGDGRGKLSFIGGHSYATTLPYSTNYEAPYVRFFLNALFFNGAAVARLALYSPTTSVSVGVPSTFPLHLKNVGASTATNILTTTITLAAGVTYTGFVSGTPPSCDPTGLVPAGCASGVLTWPTLPDIPGGASGVVFSVSRTFPSVTTPPINPPNVATMTTNYGDTLGETFKGGDCHSMTVTAAPVPTLVKTRIEDPADPGSGVPTEYLSGNTVYWNLAYSNTGNSSLLNSVLTDVVPAGFTVSAANTTPAPDSVAPQADGTTIVKWTIGTLAAAGSGNITLATTAPTIAGSSQVFTNSATLSGFDASGARSRRSTPRTRPSFGPASRWERRWTRTRRIPATCSTYTVASVYPGTVRLTNATVSDTVPANTTYVAASANANGIVSGGIVTWNLGSNSAPINGATPPIGYALCPATATFDTTTGIIDTYIDKSNPTTNSGASNRLVTRPANASNLKYTLVRFNISGIPAGSIIQSAQFGLTVQGSRNKNHFDNVYKITTAWTEAGATWNSPGAGGWAGGGAFSNSDYAATNYGIFVPRSNNTQYTVDVAGAVSDWVNGAPNNGLVLVSTGTDGGDARYYSDEEGTASRRPVLVVTYLTPVGPLTPPAVGCSGAPTVLYPSGDAYVDQNSTNNFGTGDLETRPADATHKKAALLQFDLSAIPPGAVISSAFLQLNVRNARAANHVDEIRRLTSKWNEAAVTWTTRNGVNSWAAGAFTSADYAATVYNTVTPSVTGTTTPCGPQGQFCRDVTALVDDWVNNGFANDGLALVSTGIDAGNAVYYSRDETIASGRRPTLIVNWTAPPNIGAATTTALEVSPLLLTGPANVTVTMRITAGADIGTVTPPTNLGVTPGNTTVVKISGPTPASAPVDATTPATFTWVYSVTPGATPDDTLYFSGEAHEFGRGHQFRGGGVALRDHHPAPHLPGHDRQPSRARDHRADRQRGELQFRPGRPGFASRRHHHPTAGTFRDEIAVARWHRSSGRRHHLHHHRAQRRPRQRHRRGHLRTVPANTSYAGCSNACTPPGAAVVWSAANIGTILPGTAVSRSFTVTASTTLAASCAPTTLSNTATTTGAVLTTNTVTNSLDRTPRLSIAKSSNIVTDTVTAGQNIVYSLSVRNNGSGNATNIVVTDAVPAGTTFVGCAGGGPPACSNAAGTVTWTIPGPLAGGTTAAALTLTVNVPVGQVDGSSITNGASLVVNGLACGTAQSNLVTNTVSAPPLLAITKASSPVSASNVTPGQVITYTITVTNNGPGYTSDAVVTDAIPANTTYVPNSTRFIAKDGSSCPIEEVPGSVPIAGSLPVSSPPAVCPAPGDPAGTDGGTLYTTPPVPPITAPTAATFTFQVRVNDPVAINTSVVNTAYAAVGSPSSPCTASPAVSPTVPPYCIFSNTTTHQVPSPTVALAW